MSWALVSVGKPLTWTMCGHDEVLPVSEQCPELSVSSLPSSGESRENIINSCNYHLPHMAVPTAAVRVKQRGLKQHMRHRVRLTVLVLSLGIGASTVTQPPRFRNQFKLPSQPGEGRYLLVIRHMPLHLLLSTYVYFYIPKITRKRLHGTPWHTRKNTRISESTINSGCFPSSAVLTKYESLASCYNSGLAGKQRSWRIHLNCPVMSMKALFNGQWESPSCINPSIVSQFVLDKVFSSWPYPRFL